MPFNHTLSKNLQKKSKLAKIRENAVICTQKRAKNRDFAVICSKNHREIRKYAFDLISRFNVRKRAELR